MGYVILVLLAIFLIKFWFYYKKEKKYTKKLNNIIFIENDPVAALNFINQKISNSNLEASERHMVEKFCVLVWLGNWGEANRILKWILQTKRFRKIYRVHFYKILLGFFTHEYNLVNESYNKFMNDRELDKRGISKIETKILECLYTFHIEKAYRKCLEIFDRMQKKHEIPILYLAVLNYYIGQAKLELGEIIESISCFSRAKVFGQYTFLKDKSNGMLMKIKDDASEQNKKEIINAIEKSLNEAHIELKDRIETMEKQI